MNKGNEVPAVPGRRGWWPIFTHSVCACMYLHVCMHVSACVRACICMCACVYLHVCMQISACVHAYICGTTSTAVLQERFTLKTTKTNKPRNQGRRDASALKNTHCSSGGPQLSSQHPHSDLQLPMSQFQGMELPHLTSKSTRYTCVTHTYMQAKHSHT